MVMKRRHRENPFAGELETQHLENDRHRFDHEHATNDNEQQFLFATNCHHSKHAADSERSGVAHKNFRRMTIEPKKPETGADQGRADDGQFSGERIEGDLQVFGQSKISSDVREQRVIEGDGDGATRCQPVETIGQIDGVGTTNDHQPEKEKREQTHVRDDRSFYERHKKLARLHFKDRAR